MATNRNKGLGLSADTKNVEAERLQGERFLQLSQRCHEQNWGLVHSLAEQILSHRRETEEAAKRAREEVKCDINGNGENKAGDTVKDHDDVSARAISKHQHIETNNDLVHLKKQSNTLPLKRAAREGTVSISGKIVHIDSSAYAELGTGEDEINRTAGVGNAQNQGQIEVSNANASTVDAENFRSSNVEENSEISNINANPNSNSRNNATPIPQPKPLPYPAQPRMLSTCLGTASPLAWTCRYSAPSTTVKLVLDLEMSAVRRCLPQLGTPLHECVERPRPLRRTPLKRGRWSHVLDCALASQNIGSNATGTNEALANEHENPLTKNDATSNTENNASKSNPTQLKRPKGSNSKKRKRKIKLPKILRGLREWRRTVRTLIQADEALLKEDLANQNAQGGNGNGGRNDSTNANITDPSSEQKINSPQDLEFRGNRGRSRYPRSCLRNSNGPVSDNEKRNYPIRATLAQDADGNTPLHFMIRRAAAPACGGGRWQSRHEENEETDDDEDYGDFEEEEEIKKAHGENREKDEKDRGNEAGDTVMNDDRETNSAEGGDNANINASINGNDLRQIEYWGTSGSSWDGVRWCMEAHLRRVEHRIARQKLWDTCSDDDMSSKGVARGVASVCLNGSGSCNNTGDVDMMDIHEDETMDGPKKAVDSKYFPHISASSEQKLPTKRKTSGVEIDTQEDERSSRSSSTVHPLLPIEEINGKFRRKKYFDDDERQDCCFDPLLGAVCDLVYSCPEAVGVPDHREYEETPLIVALKSSVYVVMEPDDNFPLPGGDDIAMLGQGNLDGLGGGFANAVLGMEGGFPIPGLGALMPNRPFGFFPDDEAMMAVLRGHGRRLERNKRRVSQSNVAHANGGFGGFGHGFERRDHAGGCDDDSYSSVSDDDSFDGDGDPRYDAFVPSEAERLISSQNPPVAGSIIHRRRARYDYQTALEYRIFCLVRIMLGAYPRAACLMISDYTPLHSGVFHGRSTDTLRLLLDAEERFCESNRSRGEMGSLHAKSRDLQSSFEPCPLLPGPAMLCTNTRGELPLHFACMRNESARSIQLLAEADPRAALVRDASGRTPLHWLWIRFVDGLLDRFGGRDAQHDDAVNEAGEPVEIVHDVEHLEFQDQEAVNTRNFPRPNQTLNSTTMRDGDAFMNDVFNISNFEVKSKPHSEIFKFDTEYIRRTRMIDRTVDFLRMRHVPAGFENVENVAAEHAITVLLKLKYLQQRRQRQSDASSIQGAGSGNTLSPEVTMSIKEEFILLAFKKFTSLIYAAFVASGAEKTDNLVDSVRKKQKTRKDGDIAYSDLDEPMASSKMLWNSLAQARVNDTTNFYLLHEACGAPRSSCPPAIARICIKLYSDQLFQFDDDGRLPLHRAAMRDLGWDPPLGNDAPLSVLRNETMVLLNDVLEASHPMAPRTFDRHRQLPLHCAIDSLVASLLCGKCRRASMHAEARVAMQKHRHAQVEISIEFLSLLLRINSSALERRDGKSRLFPFMQAATIRADGNKVVKYSTDLSRRPGFNIGNASFENEIVEEDDRESDSDHLTIIYYLFRENPSIINSLV